MLGPLRVLDADGVDVTPPGSLQRRALALLVLRRGALTSVDAAVEALWPTDPPNDPIGALQNHLSRVRKLLPPGAVSSSRDGYVLDPAAVDVDSDRLAELVGSAADPIDSATSAEIDRILHRWSGAAYPDLLDVDEARTEDVRLAELRVRAREARAAAWIEDDRTADALAELSALVDEDPLREQPRSLLMEALARVGRRVEAMRVYDDFRRLLGDELGIEPSPALREQHDALVRGQPSATTPGVQVGRLPRPALPLIGREALLDDVTELATSTRLLSLLGPGGVGKTRLLVELGHRLATEESTRPVVLCELAAAEPASVVNVVAASLGIDARPGVPLAEQVATVVGDDDLVLLADNCEHVVGEAAELLEQLLARCPNLTVVATSRERLRVPGEHLHPVPPLPTGGVDSDAVALFMHRAAAASPGFSASAEELAAIEEIVRRLDGLPLAIELAAARMFTLDVAEVLSGLDHRFALLRSGSRTSPRHETLAATVAWSYDLLDDDLRRFFTALAVYVTPFTPLDAAAVTGSTETDAARALDELSERSLVHRSADRRYTMLETLRAFGIERLEADGRLAEVSEHHARRMVDRVESAAEGLLSPGRGAIDAIDSSLPELYAALRWLTTHHELDLGGRLAGAFLDYGLLRLRPDVFGWSEMVRSVDPDDVGPHAPRMWVLACYGAWMAGDLEEAHRCSDRASEVAWRRSDPVPPEVLTVGGNIAMFMGDLEGAARRYRSAAIAAGDDAPRRLLTAGTELLALGYADHPETASRADEVLAEIGDVRSPFAAYLWYCAGEAVLSRDVALARQRLARAIDIGRETGTSFVIGVAGASLTSIEARIGDPCAAAVDYKELIDHWQRAGMWSAQWTMLRSIAALLNRLERHSAAAVLVGAVRATDAGHRIFGVDELAMQELERDLRQRLGDEAFDEAAATGATLDGSSAVEHALRSL